MPRHLHGETVTIVRESPAGTDQYGDPLPSTITRIDVPFCAVAFRYANESTERGRTGVIVGLTVYPPPSSGFRSTDSVEVRGIVYQVDGKVAEWANPFTGDAPGDEIALKGGDDGIIDPA